MNKFANKIKMIFFTYIGGRLMFPRANTLGIVIKDSYILLEEKEGKHSKGEGIYYRPIGGTIEFGERSDETLIREFKEELGVDIFIKRYVPTKTKTFLSGASMTATCPPKGFGKGVRNHFTSGFVLSFS